ncbi:restriction endonuclease subunit S [Seonamhaeicola sp. NFXS20]|uniref:restriction endonuclease subunit S n=1 Tax=Seonamhaeicola sp. NFXS20 TaxID=2816959 RepID=UPI003B8DCF87
MNEELQMREDWVECKLGDLLKLKNGFAFKSSNYKSEGIPVLRIGDIQDWSVDVENAKRVDENEEYDSYIVKKGDILIAMSGATTGKFGIYNSEEKAYQNQRVGNLIPHTDKYTFKNYIYFLLYSLKRDIEIGAYGGAQPNISATKIEALKTKLFPIPIQKAIVKKIEALFSSLDSGIADLKKAQEQLKIYRQAVLKKAFEGELTKEWREKQTDLPSADELLEQIKEERQKHYDQQLADWKEAVKVWEKNGKEGKKPSKPQKIKEFKEISTEDYEKLPKLPANWNWEKFGNVCLKIMDGTHFSPKNIENGDYKYITAKNIKEGRIDLKNLSYVTKEDHREIFSRCDVKKGDVLYIKDGATTGRAAINTLEEEFSLLSSVGVFRTSQNLILPKFLEHYLNAQSTRNRMLSNIAGVAITRLTLVKLNNSKFIICSPKEQHQIVQEIESRLSVCDKVEKDIADSLEKAQALRQSILKKAFEGKLLSEKEIAACKAHPDYEPASVLLEKIKTEKRKK